VSGTPKNAVPHSKLQAARESAYKALQNSNSLYSASESSAIAEKKGEEIDWDYENEKLNLENRLEKRNSRRQWNKVLMRLVIIGFCLSYLMIALIGFGIMKFTNSALAVPSVVAVGIVETYGLTKLAIKYFFSEDGEVASDRKKPNGS